MIERVNLETVYFVGWPNPDSVRGFSVDLSPYVELSGVRIQEVMETRELPNLAPNIAQVTFDESRITRQRDGTGIYAGSARHWYGLDGSPWAIRALESFRGRIDFILEEAGPK